MTSYFDTVLHSGDIIFSPVALVFYTLAVLIAFPAVVMNSRLYRNSKPLKVFFWIVYAAALYFGLTFIAWLFQFPYAFSWTVRS